MFAVQNGNMGGGRASGTEGDAHCNYTNLSYVLSLKQKMEGVSTQKQRSSDLVIAIRKHKMFPFESKTESNVSLYAGKFLYFIRAFLLIIWPVYQAHDYYFRIIISPFEITPALFPSLAYRDQVHHILTEVKDNQTKLTVNEEIDRKWQERWMILTV